MDASSGSNDPTQTVLRIDRLTLKNYRCFEACEVNLHPKMTVLVAENGGGKTAVLDGLAHAAGVFVDSIAGTKQASGFHSSDIRLIYKSQNMVPITPTSFQAEGYIFDRPINWSRSINSSGTRSRTSKKLSENVQDLADQVRSEGAANIILPLAAYYGTARLWGEHRLTKGRTSYISNKNYRHAGYIDCLFSSSSFKGVITWFQSKMEEIRDPRFAGEIANSIALIAAVNSATKTVLAPTEWSSLDWNSDIRDLMVMHPHKGILPLSSLSDGVRTMLALVADLARRCAVLNPHLGEDAAKLTPGILLIDEIDMHLHPRWQQLIAELLRSAFPSFQIIMSTHSPQVLSTVDKSSIRIIHINDGQATIKTPEIQTKGVESADVLAAVMDVDPVPKIHEAALLASYRALIEDGLAQSEDAKSLRSTLETHFGATHPLMIDCDRLIRFQEFKAKKSKIRE